MSMMKEFKEFAMKGNVMDLAVAVIIGGAFGAIVNSLVADIIMPIIGVLTGGIDFSGLSKEIGAASITYGKFIQAIFNFIIVAASLFLMIKALNSIKKKEAAVPAAPEAPSTTEKLLMEIRDSLKNRP